MNDFSQCPTGNGYGPLKFRDVACAVFGADRAQRALITAGEQVGVAVSDVQLVRLGENAVFRIGRDVVVRVARPHADVERLVDVSRWLEREQLQAVRALDVEQPVRADGLAVTFWWSLGNETRYGSARDLGQLLRHLHTLPASADLQLTAVELFDRAELRIRTVPIGNDDRAFMWERLVQLREAYAGLVFVLPAGHVHGDASVGNVLLDQDGTPTLIDLDDFAVGPREWDLVPTAIYYERFGWHTEQEYAAFVDAYGFDVMRWPGYPTLADVYEFQMVTWIAQRADESEQLAAEVARRIDDLRTGASRRGWVPY
jgi:aminoglycoside phosphotransferase (APT) family kinase protein